MSVDNSAAKTLDSTDKAILNELQSNSRINNTELARRVKLSPPSVHSRLKRLEIEGFIRQYATILEPEMIGYDMICFINVSLESHDIKSVHGFWMAIHEIPEILEVYRVTGNFDYMIKVIIKNRSDLERFLVTRLLNITCVTRIQTIIVLSELKSTTVIPID
ncbi:MAG: hypothetical protein B6242_04120 [Anaerolineaceae bacterium 4572_78]|nr:MAG: hypothetical protein B6242_04120 [Anaerolineaceae bacterium 4572_78]